MIEIDGPELPSPDGGPASLRALIERSGLIAQYATLSGIWVEIAVDNHDGSAPETHA